MHPFNSITLAINISFLKSLSLGFGSLFAIAALSGCPKAYAHEVEVSGDVGGLLHVEPNDNPMAGKPTQIWIALTKRGGDIVPLEQCDCEMEVRMKPIRFSAISFVFPTLKSISAERYQGVPGAEVIFPRIGRYQVQLRGKPKAGANFSPFVLNFEVTVATGRS
jgi:hypothetical protein